MEHGVKGKVKKELITLNNELIASYPVYFCLLTPVS